MKVLTCQRNLPSYFSSPFALGPIGKDGNECPVSCPVVCGVGEKNCGSGSDENGCPMPDTCRSMYGKYSFPWNDYQAAKVF